MSAPRSFRHPSQESDPRPPESRERLSTGGPAETDGPVLAVLPFVALTTGSTPAFRAQAPGDAPPESGSGSARDRAFAHGLTDRLGALFTRSPGVTVVSHAATHEDAAARGARYVLEGNVRFVPGALRVTAKLHDAARGILLWGDTYDRRGADDRLFGIEDEIAREIAIHVLVLPQGAVHVVEAQERAGHPPRSAYEVTLRFLRWFLAFDPRTQVELGDACARFLAHDADDGLLSTFASFFHMLSAWTALGTPHDRRRGAELGRRAVTVEPNLASSHQALAFVLLDAGDGRGALAEAEAALRLGGPLMLTGLILALAGDWDRGTAIVRAHTSALKRFPGAIRHALFLDAYRRGDYAAALAEAEAMATPNFAWDPLDRAVSLARLGRLPEARAAGRELVAILPEVRRDPRAVAIRMTASPALVEDLTNDLRLACAD